jgi:hypothetical protein
VLDPPPGVLDIGSAELLFCAAGTAAVGGIALRPGSFALLPRGAGNVTIGAHGAATATLVRIRQPRGA